MKRLMVFPRRRSAATPDEMAGFWFARLSSPRARASDHRRFERWKAQSPDNASAYEQIDAWWDATGGAGNAREIQDLRLAAREARPAKRSYAPAALAASAAIAMLCVLGLSEAPRLSALTGLVSWFAPQSSSERFVTAVGERSTINLRDGSVVTLDTNSELKVDFARSQRRISILRGQAMFEVAHDKARPFIVQAGDRRVMAVGTAFTVRLDDAAISVALVEGKVVVEQMAAKTRGPKVETTLQPGERLVARRGAPATVTTTDIDQATSWRSGRVIFRDTPISAAVHELNRYSETKIVLINDAYAQSLVNGVFRTGQPQDFAHAVSAVYPVTVDRTRERQIRIAAAR